MGNVPSLPAHYAPRPADLDPLKAAALSAEPGLLVISSVEGRAGLGQSVLAAALARDAEVQRAFPDGILWLDVGRQPALTLLQTLIAQTLLGAPQPFDDPVSGAAWLEARLRDKACLLIVDDVRQIEHLEALSVTGPRSCVVMTTRDSGRLAMLGDVERQLAPWDDAQALALLADWAGQPGDLPPEALEIARECGHAPLALAMMGALLRGRPELWSAALRLLRQVDPDTLRRQFPDEPDVNILRAMRVAVTALPPDARKRYIDLVIFDEPIPQRALRTLWAWQEPGSANPGLSAEQVQSVLDDLAGRALVQRQEDGAVRLHELQRRYLESLAPNLPALHTRLIEAYRAAYSRERAFSALPGDDPYMGRRLVHHMVKARQLTEASRLLLDFDWMQACLEANGIADLRAAYTLAPEQDTRLVQAALRLATPALLADPTQLAGQLLGRLLYRPPHLRGLLKQAARYAPPKAVWLRPLTCSLETPGGPLERTLTGHRERVLAVGISHDGQRAMSGAADGWLKVWDAALGVELQSWRGHHTAVSGLALLPDGRRAITAAQDGPLKLWDINRRLELAALKGHTADVTALALTPDGQCAIAAASDGTIRVWDVERGAQVSAFRGAVGPVWSLAALPDNRRVVSASDDGVLRVWDWRRGVEERALSSHTGIIYALAVSPDGRWLVSGSLDATLKVWDVERGLVLHTLKGHRGPVCAAAVTPDGEWVISAGMDGALKIWELARGLERCTLSDHQAAVRAVAVTWDGRAISASDDRTLRVWNLEHGAGLHTLTGHRDAVNALAVSPDGERILSASKDRTLKVWNARMNTAPLVLRGHSQPVNALAISADGRRAISAAKDRALKVWNLETGREMLTLTGHMAPLNAVALSPDGRRAISASADRTLKVWDIEQGRALLTLNEPGAVIALAWIGPKTVVAALAEGALKRWDVEQGTEQPNIFHCNAPITAMAANADGTRLALGLADGSVGVWEAALRAWPAHPAQTTAVAISSDGQRVVSGSADGVVKLWNGRAGDLLAAFSGESAIQSCALSPDGTLLVAGEKSGRLHFLHVEETHVK